MTTPYQPYSTTRHSSFVIAIGIIQSRPADYRIRTRCLSKLEVSRDCAWTPMLPWTAFPLPSWQAQPGSKMKRPMPNSLSIGLIIESRGSYLFLEVGEGPLPAFAAAQRAFIAAASFALTSGEKTRFFFPVAFAALAFGAGALSALILAQRAFCAATMRARPAADIPPFLTAAGAFATGAATAATAAAAFGAGDPEKRAASSASSAAICSESWRPRWSCARVGVDCDMVRRAFVACDNDASRMFL